MTDIVNNVLGNFLYGALIWAFFTSLHFIKRRFTMSKKKTEDGSMQTADGSQETVETPQAELPQAEPPASKPDKTKSESPTCKHTDTIKLGMPYKSGEQTLQLLKCVQCNHVFTEIL